MRVALAVKLATSAMVVLTVHAPVHAATGDESTAPVVITLATAAGKIDVTVDVDRAPVSAGDFLRYVDQGLYDGAAFYRVVRGDNDHGTPPIQVVQGGILGEEKALEPVTHETTEQTGITHSDGVISLARGEAGTGGGAAFFICIGDQPALDHGGLRNPDGLGFAAFGRVTSGMDVVRAIHGMPTSDDAPLPYLEGQLLAEPVTIMSARRLEAAEQDRPGPTSAEP